MKIIYIADARIPTERAHGYQICKMCEELSSAQIEVELWIPKRNNNIKESVFNYYNLKNNFKIKKIKSLDLSKHDKILGSFGYHTQSLFFLLKLLFIKINKDVVVYSRNIGVAWIFSIKGKKVIYEMHSYPETKNNLFNFFIKRIKKIVVINEGLKMVLINNKILEKNILVARDGVDLEKFNINISKDEARKKLNLPLDKKIAVYVGHLYKWKGAHILADAAKKLNTVAEIIFVGGTKDDVNKIKEKYKEQKNIKFIGHVNHRLSPYYMKAAEVLVLPNSGKEKISEKYTSPLKLFEYMASGSPIVASNLPSLREILNQNNCVFFQPDNSRDLAFKMDLLFNNKELRDKISSRAFSDVKNYTWEKRTDTIINFIK